MFLSSFDPQKPSRLRVCGAPAGHDARILAEAARACGVNGVVFVAEDDVRAALMAETLAFFAPKIDVLPFPAWDCLPYDRISPHPDIVGQRLATLALLSHPFRSPTILLTTVGALTQRVVPPETVRCGRLTLAVGESVARETLISTLYANGYRRVGTVREIGECAVRGAIVDLYPTGAQRPTRVDFFGDEIESMRFFDPLSQITTEEAEPLTIFPTSEVLFDERSVSAFRTGYRALFGVPQGSDPLYDAVSSGKPFPGVEHWLPLFHPRLIGLLDYLPRAAVFFNPNARAAMVARADQIQDFYKARLSLLEAARRGKDRGALAYKPLSPERLYLGSDEIEAALSNRVVCTLSPFQEPDEGAEKGHERRNAGGGAGRDFADARTQSAEGALYIAVKAYATQQQATGKRVAIACYSRGAAERLAGLLRAHGLDATALAETWEETRRLDPRLIVLIVLGLENGFTAPDLVLMTERDILGDRLVRKARKKRNAQPFQLEIGGLEIGDFVVHAEHGIGRYEGLETIEALGAPHDCIRLIYEGGDKLFVPVENMDALSRYASCASDAQLDKLGGAAWQSRKARVKKRLLDMAEGLLKIAAARRLRDSAAIVAPESAYQEFAARFPYNETEDQDQAIAAVLADLASGRPMDRLVCGDVGFGKTEVALRAAFSAAQAGYQVAVVAPTTLLCRQHYRHFAQRFAGFPVRIAQLSRLTASGDSQTIREGLKDGGIDIVIGTHALLSTGIGFQRLGLVIVDEEQHFGVKQKERLKQWREDVHVLTLTATPIPRTLQLAFTGVKELSLIATPPVDRLAVSTYVLPFDPMVIKEALMREHYRGGQSFYVCPRIEDLASVAATLRELVPDLKTVTAHGRMSAGALDDIMTAFDGRAFDVLLATNIVESGLDIPNANTIVLHRADMFGLAQLYQLRGRVGRAKQRGYAYLTYAPEVPLSSAAQQRLEAIGALDQLGAGFQLASHDMDIRGAGNLLGEEQSGHIREVGIELYQQMLEDAVAAAKAGDGPMPLEGGRAGGEAKTRWTPQINVGLSVMIPDSYVPDLSVRLSLYRRLADGDEDQEAIAAEMLDRFGPLPVEVENLIQTVAIKSLCRIAGVAKLDVGGKGAVIGFYQDRFARPDRLVAWIGNQTGTVKVRPDQKLVILRAWDEPTRRVEGLTALLKELAALCV